MGARAVQEISQKDTKRIHKVVDGCLRGTTVMPEGASAVPDGCNMDVRGVPEDCNGVSEGC